MSLVQNLIKKPSQPLMRMKHVGLHARLSRTIDELSTTRNMPIARIEQWPLNK